MKDFYKQVDEIAKVAQKFIDAKAEETKWMYDVSSLQIYALFLLEMRKLIDEILPR